MSQIFEDKKHSQTHDKHKKLEYLTNTQLEIHCTSITKIFNLSFNQSGRQFELRLHQIQYLNQNFTKKMKIELEDKSIVSESKYKEIYLLIHQYKFTFVNHFQLFDFQI